MYSMSMMGHRHVWLALNPMIIVSGLQFQITQLISFRVSKIVKGQIEYCIILCKFDHTSPPAHNVIATVPNKIPEGY